jgi:ferric iron reductase protein FhuF
VSAPAHATRPLPASALPAGPADPLRPILDCLEAVRRRHGEAPVHGLTPGLVVPDPAGWLPATRFADGTALPELLDAAHARWNASPHAAAALAWKSYTYWVVLPAVLGYAYARRVPDVSAENTLVRLHVSAPFLEIGLRRPLVAVPPGEPMPASPSGVRVVEDLVAFLKTTVLDQHLAPVLDALTARVHVGRRTLLGSLASGVGYALVRAQHALPEPAPRTAKTLLTALGVDDLVEVSAGEPMVRRRTCCLAFTLPEPKVCRGCCLPARTTGAPTRRSAR